jgi:hypothetical protein
MVTERVLARIVDEYPASYRASARAMIERLGAELSMWHEVCDGDRVELAALAFAGGDVSRLHDAVDLALRDWRDLLVAVGDA